MAGRLQRLATPRIASRPLPGVLAALAMGAVALAASLVGASEPSLSVCLANEMIVPVTGVHDQQYREASPAPGTTFDAREATFVSYPFASTYPFSIGKATAPTRLCIIGGMVLGQQPRSLTWDEMKVQYDGDGLRIGGNDWYVADGARIDNVEDGVAPRGTEGLFPKDGDGLTLRNLYLTYIRDDCIENDDIVGGVVVDSLFDGCYTGVSEVPSSDSLQWGYPAPQGETLTLDHVLLRLEPMPGPRGTNDPTALGHGKLFKWSSVANSLVLRDSVFLVEQKPSGATADFPAGTTATNVTVVWLGSGSYPGVLPASGVTVTTDRSVWDAARAEWLGRHGCVSFELCSKLHDPDPYSVSSPAPEPAPDPSPSSSAEPSPTPEPSPTLEPSPSPEPSLSPSPTIETMTFDAAADATIRAGRSSTNYGSTKALAIDADPLKDSLLRFTVSGIGSRTVVRARVVLWCIDGSAYGGRFARVEDQTWIESTVTWSNAPAADPAFASFVAVSAGRSYELDVSALVTGDGSISVRISPVSADGAGYASKEHATVTMHPQLIVDVA